MLDCLSSYFFSLRHFSLSSYQRFFFIHIFQAPHIFTFFLFLFFQDVVLPHIPILFAFHLLVVCSDYCIL